MCFEWSRASHLKEIPHQGHQVHHRGSQGGECNIREEGLPLTAAAQPKQCYGYYAVGMESKHVQPWKRSNRIDNETNIHIRMAALTGGRLRTIRQSDENASSFTQFCHRSNSSQVTFRVEIALFDDGAVEVPPHSLSNVPYDRSVTAHHLNFPAPSYLRCSSVRQSHVQEVAH